VRTAVKVGVVAGLESGCELARKFDELPQAELRWTCGERIGLRGDKSRCGARQTSTYADLLSDESLDAVALAVPIAVRYELALAALQADKHVYVAGAAAATGEHARALVAEARRRGRRLMESHPSVFDPAVRHLKALIDEGKLGEIFYLRCRRNALGAALTSGELMWSVAADNVALMLELVGDEPVEIGAVGETYLDAESPDVLDCRLRFSTGIMAHLHFSTLDPEPAARLRVVGSAATAVFDDRRSDRRLTLFSRGTAAGLDAAGSVPGDVVSPYVRPADPLRLSCEHFLTSVRSSAENASTEAVRVVDVLDALQRSLPRREPNTDTIQAPDLRLVGVPAVGP
jgi:predicted dehydrogenase